MIQPNQHPCPLFLQENVLSDRLIEQLSETDSSTDTSTDWPETLWGSLEEAGARRWSIPVQWGGADLGASAVLRAALRIAEGSLTAAFIHSQFNAAVRRLVTAAESGHQGAAQWLEQIALGSVYTTVSTSQLTTSKRRGSRALEAIPDGNGGYRLSGAMPWVTAADQADLFVVGAVLEDDRQLLIALPRNRSGVSVGPPMELAALQASRTTEVACEGVRVEASEVLYGPDADVLSSSGRAGAGGLETSALALGQSRAALLALREVASKGADLDEPLGALERTWQEITADFLHAADGHPDGVPSSEIRKRANALAIRSTQAYLTARRGSGFLRPDPAQRWARQALFFLVWSCPKPVAQAALLDFAGLCSL